MNVPKTPLSEDELNILSNKFNHVIEEQTHGILTDASELAIAITNYGFTIEDFPHIKRMIGMGFENKFLWGKALSEVTKDHGLGGDKAKRLQELIDSFSQNK